MVVVAVDGVVAVVVGEIFVAEVADGFVESVWNLCAVAVVV